MVYVFIIEETFMFSFLALLKRIKIFLFVMSEVVRYVNYYTEGAGFEIGTC